MTTAIIGTGGIGSVIARELASGGEALRLSSADNESARTLAAEIGRAAVVAVDNHDALQGAAWPWRLEPCRPISSSPLATGHRSRRSSSTRPTTTVPARKSSG